MGHITPSRELLHSTSPSHENTRHLKVLKGKIQEQNIMLSFIPGESRWSKASVLENASELGHMLPATRATVSCRTSGGRAEIASESCVPRAMMYSLCGPRVSAATGRQLLAWLPAPFLFHYSTFHLEWRLKVSQQVIISLGKLRSVCPASDSKPKAALLTFR